MALTVEELLKAGGKLPAKSKHLKKMHISESQKYALRILGILADAPDQNTRFLALGKAERMLKRK